MAPEQRRLGIGPNSFRSPWESDDSQRQVRVLAFNIALFVCVPVYVAVYLGIGGFVSACIVGAAGVLILGNLWILRSGYSAMLCGHILTAIGWITYTSLACVNGGHNSPPEMWYVTIPVFAIILTSIRAGMLWSLASGTAIGVFYAIGCNGIELPNELTPAGHEFLEFSGLIGLMTVIFALTFCFTQIERSVEKRTKSALQKAELASQAKSEFLANMSHEIRTPMTAILGFTDMLSDELNNSIIPEQRQKAIDSIKNASKHLMTIINDILDLSKIEAGKMTLERIETPLISLLHEVNSLMRPRAIGKGITLDTEFSGGIPERIISDPTRLRQILMNLIGNAVKFTELGSVTVNADVEDHRNGKMLVVKVSDTGIGISPDLANQLFTPFTQADNTVTRKFGGSGLGLTICSRLAESMGGTVTLVRTEQGIGSCFQLLLPLDIPIGTKIVSSLDIVLESDFVAQSPTQMNLDGRILLAEDGVDNQRLIAFHLRKAGAIVDVADNGLIAIEMLESATREGKPYQLLLTDMQMPEMDGYALAKTLRERQCKLPIIALTAHAMADDRQKCLDAGCHDYSCKPIDKSTLLAICDRWMNQV
jgi:signal transduction histidine kinase/ActR/RegA family two-component response regulator